MRLRYISLCGFRGFREPTRVDLAPGFTVLVGPNGSGKSTICDAIEFALLGRIRPSSDHRERGESIDDYVWWRGLGAPKDKYVELGLVTDAGEDHLIRRSPAGVESAPGLKGLLIDDRVSIEQPIEQLCRTAVLRDEDITRLSVDLPETERFSFVRAALGSADFGKAEATAKKVGDYLSDQLLAAQRAYEVQRSTVADLTAKLSSLRAEASRVTDLDRVERSLRELLGSGAGTLSDLARDAEAGLAESRTRADALRRLYKELARLHQQYLEQESADLTRQVQALSKKAEDLAGALEAARSELAEATVAFQDAESTSPRVMSLAQLHEHGSRLGLMDGGCPLCGLKQDENHFTSQLQTLKERIDGENADLAARLSRATSARSRVESLQGELSLVRSQVSTISGARSGLLAEITRTSQLLVPLGVAVRGEVSDTLQSITAAVEFQRVRSMELETALSALGASQAAAQLADRELELGAARSQLSAAERALSRLSAAKAAIKESVGTLRRVQGEVIDEQLAALSPLLAELFHRLRPHVDWQTVRYKLRGDVRRMLSLASNRASF